MGAKKIAEIKFFLDNINLRLNDIYTARHPSIFSRLLKNHKTAFVFDISAFFPFHKNIKIQETGSILCVKKRAKFIKKHCIKGVCYRTQLPLFARIHFRDFVF